MSLDYLINRDAAKMIIECIAELFGKKGSFSTRIESLFQDFIKVIEVTPTKHAIIFPMFRIDASEQHGGPAIFKIFFVYEDGGFYLSDEGATYEELDRTFDLNELDVTKNLSAIMRRYGCRRIGKNITIECSPQDVLVKTGFLIQAISFMLNMKIFYS